MSAPRVVTLDQLPLEILRNIPFTPTELVSVCVVSKRLNEVYTTRLYERAALSRAKLRKLFHFVDTIAQRPDLAQYVKHISLKDDWEGTEQETEHEINQTKALFKSHEGPINMSNGLRRVTLKREAIIVFLLVNLPNLKSMEPYSYAEDDYDGLLHISFKKLEAVGLVPAYCDYLTGAHTHDGPPNLHFGNILPLLVAQKLKSMVLYCLHSRGVGILARLRNGSSQLKTLRLFGTNIPGPTLYKLLRVTSHLRSFFWDRDTSDCATSPNAVPLHCVAAQAFELTYALQPIKRTVGRLELRLSEQHSCNHHDARALDLRDFRRLNLLVIVPELLLTSRVSSCTLNRDPLDEELFVTLADRLPASLTHLVFLDVARRNRSWRFWTKLVHHILANRETLPNSRLIYIKSWHKTNRCDLCSQYHPPLGMSDACCSAMYEAGKLCLAAGIKLKSPWFNTTSYLKWLEENERPNGRPMPEEL